jgi:hypothetical protein
MIAQLQTTGASQHNLVTEPRQTITSLNTVSYPERVVETMSPTCSSSADNTHNTVLMPFARREDVMGPTPISCRRVTHKCGFVVEEVWRGR